MWKSKILNQFPEIVHGCVGKKYGPIGFIPEQHKLIVKNRENLAQACMFPLDSMRILRQVHGTQILRVTHPVPTQATTTDTQILPAADAMVSNTCGITLIIRTADCVPILLYDPKEKAVGAVHAGWKGTLHNVVGKTISEMRKAFNIDPTSLNVVMGPAICSRHYDITTCDDGRYDLFNERFPNSKVVYSNKERLFLDLFESNKILCLEQGIQQNHIEQSIICTFEESGQWASYRANKERDAYQNWSFIYLK